MMTKKRLEIILVLAMALGMVLALGGMAWASTSNAYTINWSGPYNEVNTPSFNLYEYLPSDAVITGITVPVSTLITGATPTYSDGHASIAFTTKVLDNPASETTTFTITTSNYGTISFTLNLSLTGKQKVTISASSRDGSVDGSAHPGYRDLSGTLNNGAAYTGTYTFAYSTEEGTVLNAAPVEAGNYKVTISVPADNADYYGSLTLPFKVTDNPEAAYQIAAGGQWLSGSFTEALDKVYTGGTVRLLKNLDLSSTVAITKDVTITSADDIRIITSTTSGHGYLLNVQANVTLTNLIVDGGSTSNVTAARALIAVSKGKLTLGSGVVVRNNNNITTNGAGGGVCVIGGNLEINGGTISGNTANSGGGIAMVNADAYTTTFKSGSITGNSATKAMFTGGGGAVYIAAGSFIMTGGSMENNRAASGGAIYLTPSGHCSFTLKNGTISGNTATYGGGICAMSADLAFSGGSVTGNTATADGGGVYETTGSTIHVSGSINITGNRCGEGKDAADFYLIGGDTFTVGVLSHDAHVNFYARPANYLDQIVGGPAGGYTISEADVAKFVYEDEAYILKLDNGNIVLAEAPPVYTVAVTNDGNGTASPNLTSGESGTKVTLTATPNAGYRFKQWQVISGGVVIADHSFTIGTADVEIKAVFERMVDIPVFSPASGILVDRGSSVSITCATEGATIYYTTDGSTPTHDSIVYREPIVISGDTTIKAISVKAGMADSVVATAEYTLKTNASVPVITSQPVSASYVQNAMASVLTVEASASDVGMLSYQWYSNTKNAGEGGTPIQGATNPNYTPPTGTTGTTYYYCVVTHTNENATGTQTAIAVSSIAKIEILDAPVLPETGDNHHIGLWIALCVLSLTGMRLMRSQKRRRA